MNIGFPDDRQAALGDLRGLDHGTAGQVRGADDLPDHRGSLAFLWGQADEHSVSELLGLVELAGLEVGGDAEGVEPVLVQEPRPRAVLVRVGDGERFLGLTPGFQRLLLLA